MNRIVFRISACRPAARAFAVLSFIALFAPLTFAVDSFFPADDFPAETNAETTDSLPTPAQTEGTGNFQLNGAELSAAEEPSGKITPEMLERFERLEAETSRLRDVLRV